MNTILMQLANSRGLPASLHYWSLDADSVAHCHRKCSNKTNLYKDLKFYNDVQFNYHVKILTILT